MASSPKSLPKDENPYYLQAAEELQRRRTARKSLYEFVRQAWSLVEAAPFVDNWHIGALCEHLQAVTQGQIPKLLINIPPGAGKSLLACVFWPAWEWVNDATVRWFFASYDSRLSTRDSVKCRALLNTPWYQTRCAQKFRLTGDQNQKTYYETDHGGYRLATSVGGHGTGEHPDRIVCDDPHNVQQAESPTERQAVLDWWDLTMSTRGAARNARRVLIMQRLHAGDLSAHVLEQGGWEHLCLPMRCERGRRHTTCLGWNDPRSEENQLLCPPLFDEEQVRALEKSLGSYGAAGQLQQRPVPREGGMFQHAWFNQVVEAAPARAARLRYWDRAATAGGGCYTCGLLLARAHDGRYYGLASGCNPRGASTPTPVPLPAAMSNNEERAMTRTLCSTLLTIGAILVASPGALLAAEQTSTVDKPNIIFILADDLGLDGVGCYGSDKYKTQTPNIDIPAPDKERPAGPQHASEVLEPGVEQPVEGFLGNEVIGQRPVFGPQLLRHRSGLVGRAQRLPLGDGGREGTEAGCPGVVAPRLNLDVVGRIRVDQVDGGAGEQAVYLLGSARVATQQPVFATAPTIRRCSRPWGASLPKCCSSRRMVFSPCQAQQ